MRTLRSLLVAGLAGSVLLMPAMAQNSNSPDENAPPRYSADVPPPNDSNYPPEYSQQGYPQAAQQPGYSTPAPQQSYSTDQSQQGYDQQNNALPEATTNAPPPPMPQDAYDQPPIPEDGDIWTPGYWDWDDGWDWVPGEWAAPPYVGALWTPGYWGPYDGYWGWYPGYWGLTVGFYGGIYYGGGYFGRGYCGGYWHGGHYWNNRNVVNLGHGGNFHSYGGERTPRGYTSYRAVSDNHGGYGRSGAGAMNHSFGNSRGVTNESIARAHQYSSGRGMQAGNQGAIANQHSFNNRAGANNNMAGISNSRSSTTENRYEAFNNANRSAGFGSRAQQPVVRTYNQPRSNGFAQSQNMNRGYSQQAYRGYGYGNSFGSRSSTPGASRSYSAPSVSRAPQAYSAPRGYGGGASAPSRSFNSGGGSYHGGGFGGGGYHGGGGSPGGFHGGGGFSSGGGFHGGGGGRR